jgi:hypothetical protein
MWLADDGAVHGEDGEDDDNDDEKKKKNGPSMHTCVSQENVGEYGKYPRGIG